MNRWKMVLSDVAAFWLIYRSYLGLAEQMVEYLCRISRSLWFLMWPRMMSSDEVSESPLR